MASYKSFSLVEFGKNLNFAFKEDIEAINKAKVIVKACGICGRDVVIWKGGFKNLKLPVVLGHEIFGFYEGKPVAIFPAINCGNCYYCKQGKENLCENLIFYGEGVDGGYAEIVYADKNGILELNDSNFENYAAAACPLATAIHATNLARIKEGDKVLVTGAGGGVGIHAIQYLSSLNAYVISVTSKSKEQIVKQYSNEVITEQDFSKKVSKVDFVFEIVGSITINESLRSLKKEGKLILIGNITGEEIILKRPALTVMREQAIVGSAAYTKKEYIEALNLIHRGKIKPYYKKYLLSNVNEALQDLSEGRVVGRAILVT